MTKPDYEPVSKAKFEELKESFKTADKFELINGIRSLFDDAYEGESVYLKKIDTLALANRLQHEGFFQRTRSEWVEMLESLTE